MPRARRPRTSPRSEPRRGAGRRATCPTAPPRATGLAPGALRLLPPALALAALLAAPAAGQAHPEILVGRDASGRLHAVFDASAPFALPASRFPGIDGYAEVFPGFSTAIGARATDDFQPVDPQAELSFVLAGADDGIAVWNDRGTAIMAEGQSFRLGKAPFDSHPVWNIAPDRTGGPFTLRLQLRDASGRHADSEVFAPAFALDDGKQVFVCPMQCGGGGYFDAAGRCSTCGMALKLLSGRNYRVDVTTEGEGAGAAEGGPEGEEGGVRVARAGKPATLRIRIASPAGDPVTKLEVVHEKLLHLLLVSNDLAWFAHEHPVIQPDGSFVLETTFPHPGDYTLFHDFTPPRVGMQVVPVALRVEGEPPAAAPLGGTDVRSRVVDGYTVKLAAPQPLLSLVMGELVVRLERDGAPVTDLQPFLGTLGHLIVISEDRKHFVHSHPLPPADGAESHAGPTVAFSALFPAPGRYKAWAQFQHRDKVLTADFVLEVASPR